MSDSNPDETMRYGVIGEDQSSACEKLEKYTGEVEWAYLKKPFEDGVLLYVDPCLDLAAVGQAFTEDRADTVKAWRSAGDIIQPGPPHAQYWEQSEARFLALVVSPFVLIQPLE